MAIRNGSGYAAAIAVLSIVVSTVPAYTAAGGEVATAGTLAWLGCWRLEAEGEDAVPESADASQFLCLEPGDGPSSLGMRAIVDDQVAAEEMLVADGTKQRVSEGGCSGWKRTLLSADQRRLYLQSETTCEGGNQSRLSGASLIVSGGLWVDINLTRVAGERELVVRHYRLVDGEAAAQEGSGKPVVAVRLPGMLPTAASTARVVAAVPLEEEDVIEALEYLDPAVVEAMLVESRSSFAMDSRLLLRLDDAGVPGQIIDLMMALSYPRYFAVEDETVHTRPVVYNHYWAPWFHGYGYGYGYWYRHGHGHGHDDPDLRPRPRGFVISGRGYTRVKPTNMPPGGAVPVGGGTGIGGSTGGGVSSGSTSSSGGNTGGVSSGSTGGSGGSASGSGYSRGGSSSSRKAVPR